MTEKRYKISQGYNDRYCHDLKTNELLNQSQTVKRLNNLNEENQTFEKVYKDLKHKHHLLHDEYLDLEIERDDLKQAKKELIEENQELKKDIEYYKEERKALFEYFDKKDDLKLELRVDLND